MNLGAERWMLVRLIAYHDPPTRSIDGKTCPSGACWALKHVTSAGLNRDLMSGLIDADMQMQRVTRNLAAASLTIPTHIPVR